jgi:deoxyribodipyrimidine photo-lyase
MNMTVPAARIRPLNDKPIHERRDYVLYWMIGARRLQWNFALQHAVDLAIALKRPLLVFEPLDVTYPWASERLHRFVLDGMAANARVAARTAASYVPYVETVPGGGRGLLRHLATAAAAIVTDDVPACVLPQLLQRAARRVPVRLEAVDSNGLIPLSAHGGAFTSARAFRAFVQRTLRSHLTRVPERRPLARLPRTRRLSGAAATLPPPWAADGRHFLARTSSLATLPIDHGVPPVRTLGGSAAAARRLARFLATGLPRYARGHADPDADCTSHLSPYLHFGHISAHEIFAAVMTRERWTTRALAARGGGQRQGWWGVSDDANLFLDQLVVWRELAFNGAMWIAGSTQYDSLPEWARQTLEAHARDPRRRYPFDVLERAATADEVWNAAERQLVRDGWLHGYLRMLWGKKILEWAPDPPTAIAWMTQLMNRYALDGRDPVSDAGFMWVLGRYDRPWPPRPVFGTVRSMSSERTRQKRRMSSFLAQYGPSGRGHTRENVPKPGVSRR